MAAAAMMGHSIRRLVPRQQLRGSSGIDGLQKPPDPERYAVLPLPWPHHRIIHKFRQRSGTSMSSFTQAATVALSKGGEMNDEGERRQGMGRQEGEGGNLSLPQGEALQGSRGSLRLAPEPSQCPPPGREVSPPPRGGGLKVPPLGGSVPPGAHHLLSVTPCQAEVTPLGSLDQLD